MKPFYLIVGALVLLALGILFSGCGGGGSSQVTGQATVTIEWPTRLPVDLGATESLRLELLSGTSTVQTQIINRPATGTTATVTLSGLPASELTYLATAYPQANAGGTALAQGAGVVTVSPTTPAVIELSLTSTVTTVLVRPTAPVLKIGQILQMIASAKNSAGKTVLVPMNGLSWSSSNPAVVSVIDVNSGIIKGTAAGSATVTVVESLSGVSGSATVTVINATITLPSMIVLGYSELGMHCMNQDFSELMILPPFNSMHATIIDRSGEEPRIVTSGVTLTYKLPGNSYSVGKTNFWSYANALLGVNLAPNVGLTGNGLTGTFTPPATGSDAWEATGIPLTPITDAGVEDPYQLGTLTLSKNGTKVAATQAVIPVSWEISCNLCHKAAGVSTATDILRDHDRLHPEAGTLVNQKPVTCGKCHAQPPLGLAGKPGIPSLSSAMHSAHAPRMAQANLAVSCYACHPGMRTKCLRDVHYARGMNCMSCHQDMAAVGNPARKPWVDEPRCGTCHKVSGHEYEQANTLYRNSRGHMGVHCAACHNSPHAVTPSVIGADNVQAIALQGHAGTINTCTVCHRTKPDDAFPHRFTDD